MIALTLQQIAEITNGQLIKAQHPDILISDYGTDSRKELTGQLFMALKGEDFDGHDFVDIAVDKGASAVLVEQQQTVDIPQVVVKDTLQALADLGRFHRQQYKLPTIALTGSCGKTTTKEMLASILSERAQVHATVGNLNNEFGVPFTLFDLTEKDDYSVIEMGAGAPGDIDYLTRIALPDVVLITCIAEAHLERMGSLEGIAETKAGIINGLSQDGTAVLPLDERWLADWQSKLTAEQSLLTFGLSDKADIYASDIKASTDGMCFKAHVGGEEVQVSLPLQGEHNVINALAAIGCCHALSIPLQQCAEGLSRAQTTSGRLSQKKGLNGSLILDDTYNANPAAMLAGARVLTTYPGKHMMIVGDMAELGTQAEVIHQRLGKQLSKLTIDQMLSVGLLSAHLSEGFGDNALHFNSKKALVDYVVPQLNPEWVLLVKGSRSAGMEDIVEKLMANGPSSSAIEEAVTC